MTGRKLGVSVTLAAIEAGKGNALLATLPDEVRTALLEGAVMEALERKRVLWEAGEAISSVWFPISGVVSLVTVMRDGDLVEVATVGREGIVGTHAMLGTNSMSNVRAMCQIRGHSVSVGVRRFLEVSAESTELRDLVHRYVHATLVTTAQEVACNRLHPIEQRCARWLMTTRDQVGSEKFELTQEFLAEMLGVRRPSVTLAAGELQRAGLIRYRLGVIEVLDPEGLAAASCECHDVIRAELDRVGGDRMD